MYICRFRTLNNWLEIYFPSQNLITSLDDIRKSPYRSLFHPDQLIHGISDSSNNYGRAHNGISYKLLEQVLEQVRKQVELCSGLQGILFTHSIGGGTGSGFFTLLTEHLNHIYRKTFKFDLSLFPSPNLSNILVEPYNALLATSMSLTDIELGFIMDNEAVFDILKVKLGVQRPSFGHINRLISQVVSGLTCPLRFKGSLQGDMIEFQTNLIAYPRLHFPLVTFSPIITSDHAIFESLNTCEMTQEMFRWDHSFVKCNLATGRYMSACLLFRGDVDLLDARRAIKLIKRRTNFVSWCPTGIKLDLNDSHQAHISGSDLSKLPRSCCMAANHTSIEDAWKTVINKFELLYRKRAFVHWFIGEGVEETEFQLSREELALMIRDYEEASEN